MEEIASRNGFHRFQLSNSAEYTLGVAEPVAKFVQSGPYLCDVQAPGSRTGGFFSGFQMISESSRIRVGPPPRADPTRISNRNDRQSAIKRLRNLAEAGQDLSDQAHRMTIVQDGFLFGGAGGHSFARAIVECEALRWRALRRPR